MLNQAVARPDSQPTQRARRPALRCTDVETAASSLASGDSADVPIAVEAASISAVYERFSGWLSGHRPPALDLYERMARSAA